MLMVNQLIGFGAVSVEIPPPTISGANPPASGPATGFGSVGTVWANMTTALVNGATVVSVGMFADNAATLTMKILLRNSSTNCDVVVSQAFAHPGGGWADLTLSSAYVVPGSGSFYVGAYFGNNPSIKYNAADNTIKATSNIIGAGQATTEVNGSCPTFRATYG